MKKPSNTIGSIYQIKLNGNKKAFFHYLLKDKTMLGGQLIKVFAKIYDVSEQPTLQEIGKDEVSFYAHVFLGFGLGMNLWEKIGRLPVNFHPKQVLFKAAIEPGNTPEVSYNWKVWYANERWRDPQDLQELKSAEYGPVMPPQSIIDRIETGKYLGLIPKEAISSEPRPEWLRDD